MSEFRPGPTRAHPEAAGWVLGALDPVEAAAFQAHLPTCPACQAEIRDLEGLRGLLDIAAPELDMPPGLGARAIAAVREAARTSQRRRWTTRLLLAAAAIAVLTLGAASFLGHRSSTDHHFALAGPGGATGTASEHDTGHGWQIQMSVQGLNPLNDKAFYECWYVKPNDTPAKPDRVSGGTFDVAPTGSTHLQMWSWADPHEFPVMEITEESLDGNPAASTNIVLTSAKS